MTTEGSTRLWCPVENYLVAASASRLPSHYAHFRSYVFISTTTWMMWVGRRLGGGVGGGVCVGVGVGGGGGGGIFIPVID